MNYTVLDVYSFVGGKDAREATDGDEIYKQAFQTLNPNKRVNLSFKGITLVTTSFLNASIGRLYEEFTEKKIRELFTVSDTTNSINRASLRVAQTAKLRYSDQERFKARINEIMDEE